MVLRQPVVDGLAGGEDGGDGGGAQPRGPLPAAEQAQAWVGNLQRAADMLQQHSVGLKGRQARADRDEAQVHPLCVGDRQPRGRLVEKGLVPGTGQS